MSVTPPPNMADPALVANHESRRDAERDRDAIRAILGLGAWPPHPAIECGYTAPDGRRWIHTPWAGWQPAGPHIIRRRPRTRRRWWSW